MNKKNSLLFLVDDDALYLKALEIDLKQYTSLTIKTFPTGEQCLEHIDQLPDIIVLDYHLHGIDKNAMNGLETLDKIKKNNSGISVIILSSQDKIDVAVNCMKHKAFDYIIKSETALLRLQRAIDMILYYQKMEKALNWYMERS